MADANQDVGKGTVVVFAGNTLRLDIKVTTGGTAAGVSTAEWRLSDLSPVESASPTTLVTKTLGSGITDADGAVSGTVVVSVVLQPADTDGLSGDYYHELKITASGDEVTVNKGTVRLTPGLIP